MIAQVLVFTLNILYLLIGIVLLFNVSVVEEHNNRGKKEMRPIPYAPIAGAILIGNAMQFLSALAFSQ